MGKKRASQRSKGSGNKNNAEPGPSESESVCGRASTSMRPKSQEDSTKAELNKTVAESKVLDRQIDDELKTIADLERDLAESRKKMEALESENHKKFESSQKSLGFFTDPDLSRPSLTEMLDAVDHLELRTILK